MWPCLPPGKATWPANVRSDALRTVKTMRRSPALSENSSNSTAARWRMGREEYIVGGGTYARSRSRALWGAC